MNNYSLWKYSPLSLRWYWSCENMYFMTSPACSLSIYSAFFAKPQLYMLEKSLKFVLVDTLPWIRVTHSRNFGWKRNINEDTIKNRATRAILPNFMCVFGWVCFWLCFWLGVYLGVSFCRNFVSLCLCVCVCVCVCVCGWMDKTLQSDRLDRLL